jgi:eukaryotic-like serine/threonine-protein kinase
MEYVEGKSLSGPLAVDAAVNRALHIAGALEEAYSKGILHRDLKTANILVTPKGSAKLVAPALAGEAETQTIGGAILGTPAAYMAPEQAEGKPLDERSDIFSFGAVLYEMLSANRAFRGSSTAAALSAVLRDDPAPLNAPVELQRIVGKRLAKQPRDRFAGMVEIRVAPEQISSKPPDQQPSIAVLPFNPLTRVPDLKVTARTSAFSFRGKDLDIRKIGEALGVRTVLEGSVRRAGNRIRVTAQLIGIADGYHLWSERYDRDMTDVFAVQDEMSAAIVEH